MDDSTAKFASECKLPEQVMKPPSISENDNEKGFDPKQIHSTSPLQDILKKIENACREKEYYCEEYTDQSMLIILDSNDCGIKLNFYKDVDQYVIRGSCIQKNVFSFPNTFNENIFNELKAIVNAI